MYIFVKLCKITENIILISKALRVHLKTRRAFSKVVLSFIFNVYIKIVHI